MHICNHPAPLKAMHFSGCLLSLNSLSLARTPKPLLSKPAFGGQAWDGFAVLTLSLIWILLQSPGLFTYFSRLFLP